MDVQADAAGTHRETGERIDLTVQTAGKGCGRQRDLVLFQNRPQSQTLYQLHQLQSQVGNLAAGMLGLENLAPETLGPETSVVRIRSNLAQFQVGQAPVVGNQTAGPAIGREGGLQHSAEGTVAKANCSPPHPFAVWC